MFFTPTSKPVPTRSPHLMLPGTLKVGQPGQHALRWSVEAVWFGRKDGNLTASHGHVAGYSTNPNNQTLHDFLTEEDQSYLSKSSNVNTRWNGRTLWVDPSVYINIPDHIRVVQILDALYQQVKSGSWAVPAGYDGWWQPKK